MMTNILKQVKRKGKQRSMGEKWMEENRLTLMKWEEQQSDGYFPKAWYGGEGGKTRET